MISVTAIVVECQFFGCLPTYRTYPRIGKRSIFGWPLIKLRSGQKVPVICTTTTSTSIFNFFFDADYKYLNFFLI